MISYECKSTLTALSARLYARKRLQNMHECFRFEHEDALTSIKLKFEGA